MTIRRLTILAGVAAALVCAAVAAGGPEANAANGVNAPNAGGSVNEPNAAEEANEAALPEGALLRLGSTFLRHGGQVTAVAVSPDGKMLASGFNGVRLYEVASGLEAASLAAGGQLRSLAFSPDGRCLAAGGSGTVVYDLAAEATLISAMAGQEGSAVAFSPDGRRIATGGGDASVLIWNAPPLIGGAEANEPVADANWIAPLWQDLAAAEEAAKAYQAVQSLLRAGPPAAAFLKDRLKPTPPTTQPLDFAAALADMDNDNYRVREEASRRLAAGADAHELQKALAQATSDEVRARISELLANLANPVLKDPEDLRRSRAVRALELLGSAGTDNGGAIAARDALARLAAGGPSRLTRDAAAALARLNALRAVSATGLASSTRPATAPARP